MDRNFDAVTYIFKYLYLKRPRVVNFADNIKIVAILLKLPLLKTLKS